MFDRIVRVLARPAIRFWLTSSTLSRDAVPRPAETAAVHTPGSRPAHLLLIGGGIAVGFGVSSHELALAGHLARQTSAAIDRAVDLDLVIDRPMTAAQCLERVSRLNVAAFDGVVLSIGLIEALDAVRPDVWRRRLGALLDFLDTHRVHDQTVYLIAIPPLPALQKYPLPVRLLGERYAAQLNEESARMAGERDGFVFLPFAPDRAEESDRFRSSATYAYWASLLAATIGATLPSDGEAGRHAVHPEAEEQRQTTIASLGILDSVPEERFDRVARTARDLLGTDYATISIIDGDRLWFKSRIGIDATQMPRLSALSDYTIQGREHFVVEDAADDPRFRDNALVVGPPFLRFYAGYPIEAPNGVRVGTLSVFHATPRGFSSDDAALLRGLALMVQNELRSSPPPAAG
jgi:GAF domain-containing protein